MSPPPPYLIVLDCKVNILQVKAIEVTECIYAALMLGHRLQRWPNINPYSAGIDFSRQNLTSVDVRIWRLKSIPAL